MSKTTCVSLSSLAAAIGMAVALAPTDARACGGLFCSSANPVNQAAERIIFSHNGNGTVTAAIEVQYEGPSERFAWVLPVPPGEVTIGVSSKVAMDRLDSQTNPSYRLNRIFGPECAQVQFGAGGLGATAANDGAPAPQATTTPTPPPSVEVLDEGTAGPYDYQTIKVNAELDDPAEVAIQWLGDNNYDVGELGPDVLRPYLESGLNLVAFRLTKGTDSGSIRPVMITYDSEQPFIPIRPTAVAANEDMGVKVWVLGASRAIPQNYYHLELNESLINWFNPNSNYNDLVTAAADEAGGQGFVTEQSGPAGAFAESMYSASDEQRWDNLRTGQFQSIQAFLQTAISSFSAYDGFIDVLKDPTALPLREGATPEQFMACITCYFQEDVAVRNEAYPSTPFDPETDPLLDMDVLAFLDKMDELVITPLVETRALFDNASSVTRMYTTMSPDEMTVDPAFDFNPELEDISNLHVADQLMECTVVEGPEWRVELSQGMIVEGNGTTWPLDLDSGLPANFRITQLATTGPGEEIDANAIMIGSMLTDMGIGEMMPDVADPTAEPDPSDDPEDPSAEPDPEDPVDEGPSAKQDDDVGDDPVDEGMDEEPPSEDPSSEEPGDTMDPEDTVEDPDSENADEAAATPEGCGCATVGESSPVRHSGWALVGLLGLAALRRRRR